MLTCYDSHNFRENVIMLFPFNLVSSSFSDLGLIIIGDGRYVAIVKSFHAIRLFGCIVLIFLCYFYRPISSLSLNSEWYCNNSNFKNPHSLQWTSVSSSQFQNN